MHPLLLKIMPLQITKVLGTKSPLKATSKSFQDFVTVMKEARATLNRSGSGRKTTVRPEGSPATRGKASPGKTGGREEPALEIRDLSPLAVLLQESGIPLEKIRSLLDSVGGPGPETRLSVKEFSGKVRDMIVSEKGGDGKLSLDPALRLHVEAALIQSGLSPKEADRVISLSSTREGKVDVKTFIRLTMRRGAEAEDGTAEKQAREPAGLKEIPRDEPDTVQAAKTAVPEKAPTTGRPVAEVPRNQESPVLDSGAETRSAAQDRDTAVPVAGLLFKAGENKSRDAATAKEGPLFSVTDKASSRQGAQTHAAAHAEPTPKSNPLSPSEGSRGQGQGADRAGMGKAWNGPDTPHRPVNEVGAEEGLTAHPARASEAGPIPRQTYARPASAPWEPSAVPEHPVPAHVAAQVGRQISRALLIGEQTVRLNLNPPQLGVLKVQLEWSGEGLRVEMLTDRAPVRELLLASVSELRETLADQGYRVDKMEVQVNDPLGQPLFQAGREHRNSAGPGFSPGEEKGAVRDGDKETAKAGNPFTASEDRLIDLVA